jgi:hypothetical protein
MRSTNRHAFIRSLKRKGFKEEIVIKIGLYDLVTSTTLESNKSQCAEFGRRGLDATPTAQHGSRRCRKGNYLGPIIVAKSGLFGL